MSIKENLEPVSHLKKGTLKNSEYHSQPYNICDLKKIMLIPPSTPSMSHVHILSLEVLTSLLTLGTIFMEKKKHIY